MGQSRSRKAPAGFPNFFIIGAPKCGTTALSEYLRRHPNVGFSEPKEPHYFNEDFSRRHIYLLSEYMKCFAAKSGNEIAIGEGSVFYLKSKSAVPNVLEYAPDARFIVMLRNPIDAAYSWHGQSRYSFGEDIADFEEAWSAQVDRTQGRRLPKHNKVREALQYGPLFKYGEQLKRLYDSVPKDRVQVILFDEFKTDTNRIYREVLNFLNLPEIELPEYEVINSSKRFQYPFVETMLRNGSAIKRALGIKKTFNMRRLKEWNTKYERRPPLSEEFTVVLRDYYRSDLIEAARLIGKDLTEWIRG